MKLLHLTHGSHLIAKHGRVTRENKPRVHEMITNLQALVRHSRSIQHHIRQTLCTFFLRSWPPAHHSSTPLVSHCFTHRPPLLYGHSPSIGLQIKIRLTGAISPNNFIEATSRRSFQHFRNKVLRRSKGPEEFSNPPILTILTRPFISCDIESLCRYIICRLEHCLLPSKTINPHIPDRKASRPFRGGLCSPGTRVQP